MQHVGAYRAEDADHARRPAAASPPASAPCRCCSCARATGRRAEGHFGLTPRPSPRARQAPLPPTCEEDGACGASALVGVTPRACTSGAKAAVVEPTCSSISSLSMRFAWFCSRCRQDGFEDCERIRRFGRCTARALGRVGPLGLDSLLIAVIVRQEEELSSRQLRCGTASSRRRRSAGACSRSARSGCGGGAIHIDFGSSTRCRAGFSARRSRASAELRTALHSGTPSASSWRTRCTTSAGATTRLAA